MLLYAHSGLRYLVLLAGILVIGYASYGVATKRQYDKTMRILAAAFTGLIDLTVIFGLANLFSRSFYPQLGGHIGMMVLAAVGAHVVFGVMKRRPPEERTYAPHIVGTLVVLGIIAFGIIAIGRPIVG
jgi:FtsH-binding integral membrane protein